MKKQKELKEKIRLFGAIVWMNSLGLVVHIIAGLYCLGKGSSSEGQEVCLDELELNLIKLFTITGSIMLMASYFSDSKWQMIIGSFLLLLSLLGGLKRFTVNLLNEFHNE